ncbi:mosc n-terminal beta barrel domain [Holotrichia oblita]|uniref:Mosc n-terminal beta barrel domain n=1 Tax=Holotrichia oblita TaxID=644536 RepID=A0ACB9SJW1_HOLOL|nr:mosc n-terminal beta barrel domain [Holotrichia oblita]
MYCTDLGPTFTENNVELKDRSFIVYGEGNNEFKVAKTYPKLLLIQVSVNNNGDLVFTAPEQNPLIMKFPNPENKPVIITLNNPKQPAYLKLEGKRGVMGIQIELWKAGQIHVGDEVFIA